MLFRASNIVCENFGPGKLKHSWRICDVLTQRSGPVCAVHANKLWYDPCPSKKFSWNLKFLVICEREFQTFDFKLLDSSFCDCKVSARKQVHIVCQLVAMVASIDFFCLTAGTLKIRVQASQGNSEILWKLRILKFWKCCNENWKSLNNLKKFAKIGNILSSLNKCNKIENSENFWNFAKLENSVFKNLEFIFLMSKVIPSNQGPCVHIYFPTRRVRPPYKVKPSPSSHPKD